MQRTRIAINGAAGRMGRRLLALAGADPELEVVCALERAGHEWLGRPIVEVEPEAKGRAVLTERIGGDPQVLVDFSSPAATAALAGLAAEAGLALVVGTTGLTMPELHVLDQTAKRVPLIQTTNFSLGVNLLFQIAGQVAKALGEDFDIEIVEAHHNRKVDAPSGTALSLAEAVCAATGRDPCTDLVHGRSGKPGARPRREIGMHALRLGAVVGDHTVHFGSDFERIELTHKAQNRDVFAAGALRAAKWLAVENRKPGRYTMRDVLFG